MSRYKNRAAIYTMRAPMVLPATTFTVSPNTPTVRNPADSALAQDSAVSKSTGVFGGKIPWIALALGFVVGGAVVYYAAKR